MNWNTPSDNAVDYNTVSLSALLGVKRADLSEADQLIVRDRLLTEWQGEKTLLDKHKENEMALRKAVVDFAFDPAKKAGTESVELGNGWKLKSVKKTNYGWIKNADGKIDLTAIERAQAKIEKTIDGGEILAERLLKWSAELSLTEYKQLPEKAKKIIDEVIVTSDGAPTLEIIQPKGTV